MTASEIRWGTNYVNVVAFDPFPTDGSAPTLLDNVRAWRRPVPGSRRTRNDAGVTDAWIAARDYMLAGRARYFGQAWGAHGLQAFLDWAGEGNTFRLIPDRRYPSFYVDGCYLEEPFENPEPQLEESDGTQSIDLVIRQQTTDFSRAMRGVMFEYLPGMDISMFGGVFTRATTATYIDRDGVLRTAASGVLRNAHFINGVEYTLLEKESENLVLQSENFGTTWIPRGPSPTRTAAAHTASGVTLDLLADDHVTEFEYWEQLAIGFTGNGSKAVSAYVKKGTIPAPSGTRIEVDDTTLSQVRLHADVAFDANGVPVVAMSTGTYLGYEALAGGVYRLLFRTSAITAANGHSILVVPASIQSEVGNIYIGGMQVENSIYPTSYSKTTIATAPRDADDLYCPFPHAPQEMTAYCRFVDLGSSLDGTLFPGVWGITNAAGNAPRVMMYTAGVGTFGTNHHNGSGEVERSVSGADPQDDIEARSVLASTGAVAHGQTINSGAETMGSASAANALASSWAGDRLYIGSREPGTAGAVAIRALRFMAGTQSLAAIRAA